MPVSSDIGFPTKAPTETGPSLSLPTSQPTSFASVSGTNSGSGSTTKAPTGKSKNSKASKNPSFPDSGAGSDPSKSMTPKRTKAPGMKPGAGNDGSNSMASKRDKGNGKASKPPSSKDTGRGTVDKIKPPKGTKERRRQLLS
ncbi:hypothetical protein ACA910_005703 [Epithemia clementina (nom. ined.)]